VPAEPYQRFSASDNQRLAGIHEAALRTDLDVVMTTRGGYGLSRLLDRIDWGLVAQSVQRGCRWVGYSDFTALQLGLMAQTGQPSFTGPTVSADFGEGKPHPLTLAQFESLLSGRLPSVSWSCPVASKEQRSSFEGTLWGGNLAMLASLVGTPYLPSVSGGLLFLEDVSEHPYRIERMLHQLYFAGVLQAQKAIVMGEFSNWKPSPQDRGYDLAAVFDYWRARLSVPILEGLPFGHVPARAVLGCGLAYRLHISDGTAQLAPIKPAWPSR
jgi:muramoyltetrapeptide carboxypeptidase